MKKQVCAFLVAILPLAAMAQQPTGNLTVFSEDGDKFYLILNGERMNETPQTNIRVDELPQPYYNAKVIFEDKSINSVSKNALMIADVDGIMKDVTYRVRKDKNGKAKLNYYASIDVVPDFIPPSNVFVRHWGRPITSGPAYGTTTTTTTVDGAALNMNVGGMGVNMSVSTPVVTGSVTTTTTSSSSSSYSSGYNDGYADAAAPSRGGCRYAMSNSDFADAKATIAGASFDDTRLSTAKSIAGSNCLSCDQIAAICRIFSFEASRLDFAKFAYSHAYDPQNYFKLGNVFTFDASRQELTKYTSGQ